MEPLIAVVSPILVAATIGIFRWARARARRLDLRTSAMPYGFVGHWSHDPATGLVVLNGLIITNGSPKIGMNVLFSLRLSEDVILRDERYDLMRRQGVSFIAQGPMLPNPLDLRDTPTRKGSLAFPTTFAAERQAAEDSEQLRRATLVAFDLASEKRREYKLAELLQDRNP